MKKNPWYKFDVNKLSKENQWVMWRRLIKENGEVKLVMVNEKWEQDEATYGLSN